jgi:hypothetical protein
MVEREFEARRQIKASLFFYGLAWTPEGRLGRVLVFKTSPGETCQQFFDGKVYDRGMTAMEAAVKKIEKLNCREK